MAPRTTVLIDASLAASSTASPARSRWPAPPASHSSTRSTCPAQFDDHAYKGRLCLGLVGGCLVAGAALIHSSELRAWLAAAPSRSARSSAGGSARLRAIRAGTRGR